MKTIALVCLLLAAAQAAPNAVPLEPMDVYMPVLETAPKYPTGKIVNGNQASRGQFPHQAALYLDGRSFCGGSLVTHNTILTAAHCTRNIGTVTVHLGAQNLNAIESGRVTQDSRNLINHANYNPSNLNNDISLVRLSQNVVLSSFIQLIHLPRRADVSQTFAGQTATVSGWGRVSDSSSGISPQLNFVSLPIITNSVCSQTFGTSVIVASTICASGAGGRSTCNGDSGGPLYVHHGGVNTQIGVVSFGAAAGCSLGHPVGFARTTSFLDWLSSHGVSIRN